MKIDLLYDCEVNKGEVGSDIKEVKGGAIGCCHRYLPPHPHTF